MDFSLSEEQILIQDSFCGLLGRTVSVDTLRACAENGLAMDKDCYAALGELGMRGLLVDGEYGGAGLGMLEAVIVSEALGCAAAPVPYLASSVMGPLALATAASPVQKADYLPRVVDGDIVLGFGLGAENVSAEAQGDGPASANRLSGHCNFVTDGRCANMFIIADDEGGLYLVDADAEGLQRSTYETVDATRNVENLVFDNVNAERLGGGDSSNTDRLLNAGRLVLAADSLGAAEEMLRRAVAYSLEREQFGRAIGSFQAVKHLCAEMAAELQPCRALIWHGAYAFDHMPDQAALASMLAKSHMDEVARFVARSATEVHGGMGFSDLPGLHYWFKRIGFNRAFLGGPANLREKAAKIQGL